MPPRLDPQDISRTAWYYEYRTRIEVYQEVRTKSGEYIATVSTRIPLRKLEKSIECIRAKKRRARGEQVK